MKKVIFFLYIVSLSVCLLSLNDNIEFMKTESGLEYKIISQGSGPLAEKGDKVEVHYIGKLENGEEFDSSMKRGKPFGFVLGAGRVIKGWDEGIALLHEGDKAVLKIPPYLGYGDRDLRVIPPQSTLIFEISLLKIEKNEKPKYKFDVAGKDVIFSQSGLKFIIAEAGDGKIPQKGALVSINYNLYLRNGKLIESTYKEEKPFQFVLGKGEVIKGLDEAVSIMKKGSKIRFYIPAKLAYGEEGNPKKNILPNSELTYDIELIDFK